MKLIITDTYPDNGEKTFLVDSIYIDRLISFLDSGIPLPDTARSLTTCEAVTGQDTDKPDSAGEERSAIGPWTCGECGWVNYHDGTFCFVCEAERTVNVDYSGSTPSGG